MKLRCVSDYVTEQQRAALGRRPYQGHLEWGLTVGQEYLVLGLTFEADPEHFRTGPHVDLLLKTGDVLNVRSYDLCLFEISDPRASRYWEVRTREFGDRQIVDLLPPPLADAIYPSEGDARTFEEADEAWSAFLGSDEFRHLCDALQRESEDQ